MSERKRSLRLTQKDAEGRHLMLVPGIKGWPQGTYLWVGDARSCFGFTTAKPHQLSAFAHAILRSIGEEAAR